LPQKGEREVKSAKIFGEWEDLVSEEGRGGTMVRKYKRGGRQGFEKPRKRKESIEVLIPKLTAAQGDSIW